jgi:hypothetical protein
MSFADECSNSRLQIKSNRFNIKNADQPTAKNNRCGSHENPSIQYAIRKKREANRGIREILLAGVFWRILIIEMILLAWSVVYKMVSEEASGADCCGMRCASFCWLPLLLCS